MGSLLSGLGELGIKGLDDADLFENGSSEVKKEEEPAAPVQVNTFDESECVFGKTHTCPVCYNEFKALTLDNIKALYRSGDDNQKVLIDVKGLYSVEDLNNSGINWWRL